MDLSYVQFGSVAEKVGRVFPYIVLSLRYYTPVYLIKCFIPLK